MSEKTLRDQAIEAVAEARQGSLVGRAVDLSPVETVDIVLALLEDEPAEAEGDATVRDLLTWLEDRAGVSWQATINDVRHYLKQVTPCTGRDNCQLCRGRRGGVPGNENRVDGVVVCDYCHVTVSEFARLRTQEAEPVGLWPQVVADFLAWAEETFPEATPASCVAHLRSEVEELADTPDDPEELADAAMLIFHAAYRADVDLHAALRAKLEKNRAREWGPKNEKGFREHVRDPVGQPQRGESDD